MTDLVIRANEKNNEVVNNNTFAMRNLAEKMRDNHNANNKKLNEIHDDVKEIKDRLK